jgi:hypothetical protein
VDAGAVPANAHVAVLATNTNVYISKCTSRCWLAIDGKLCVGYGCGLADSADLLLQRHGPAHEPPAHCNNQGQHTVSDLHIWRYAGSIMGPLGGTAFRKQAQMHFVPGTPKLYQLQQPHL